jgi:glycosyltransferase involved in cell wall biosynthesis
MKILFLCPCLEPGKDGVGDYVTRLAFSLLNEGHIVSSIALNDHFVSQVITEEKKQGKKGYQVLRIPSNYSFSTRMNEAENWLNSFEPSWISLQYVGFGYNKYGLPIELFSLRRRMGDTNLHIMYHELWCGTPRESKLKEKVLGTLQKIFIKGLSLALRPRQIFTNTPTSQKNLGRMGLVSRLTPVFSNIPTDERGPDDHWKQLKEEKDFNRFLVKKEDWLILGFFGTVYNYMDLKKLLLHAAIAATNTGKKLGILSIGHGRGRDISKLAEEIKASYWQTGTLSAYLINQTMKLVDLGVVTTRIDGLNKSGSALAWLERGIPVIISEDDNTYEEAMAKQGVHQIHNSQDICRSLNCKGQFKIHNHLKETTEAYASL